MNGPWPGAGRGPAVPLSWAPSSHSVLDGVVLMFTSLCPGHRPDHFVSLQKPGFCDSSQKPGMSGRRGPQRPLLQASGVQSSPYPMNLGLTKGRTEMSGGKITCLLNRIIGIIWKDD